MKISVQVTETVVYHQTIDVSDDWPGINVVDYDADKHLDLCWEDQRDESAGELEARRIIPLDVLDTEAAPAPAVRTTWAEPDDDEVEVLAPAAQPTTTTTIWPEELAMAAILLERINRAYDFNPEHGAWSPASLRDEADYLRKEAEAGR